MKLSIPSTIALAIATFMPGGAVNSQDADQSQLENQVEIKIGHDIGHYLGIPARNKEVPEKGYALLIVLPGGDGSADFHPFVSNIHKNSLGDDFVLAQPLARKWTDEQVIVWPTAKLKVDKMGYATEKLIAAVVEDVSQKTKIDAKRVYALGWSSGGPAVYATLLKKNSPLTGGIAAMSVYKPDFLPKAANAKGRSIYILHSAEDQVCPYWMPRRDLKNCRSRKCAPSWLTMPGDMDGEVMFLATSGTV